MGALRRAAEAGEAGQVPKKRDGPLSHYFSLGTVMQGLSRLFQRLYGIRFVPRETPAGETWHPDVRRLDVVSDTEGHVAVLYCDLFYRDDKSPNPAHFTVRCSREIAPEEIEEAAALQQHNSNNPDHSRSPQDAANDGMATSCCRTTGVVKQLPTIALVCDFARSGGSLSVFSKSNNSKPALLTYHEVETLLHEMGHAVHSVLARTSLQTVAGTACATDLAELPSTLMEQFVADPTVLALFARHYETDAPVDYEQVAEGLRRARRFEGLDDENQIVLAMLDQAYHGDPALWATTRPKSFTRCSAPSWLVVGPSTHAVRAGRASLDTCLATAARTTVTCSTACWPSAYGGVVFNAGQDGGALQRENGEHLRDSLLRWGGGARTRGVACRTRCGDGRLAQGDEAAMALVGSWGTSHRR